MFEYKYNRNNHIIFEVIGTNFTGRREIRHLTEAKVRVGDVAKFCLNEGGYDRKHRLVARQSYRVVLISGGEILSPLNRGTEDMRKLGERYGYRNPLAEVASRICEVVSRKWLDKVDYNYIVVPHDFLPGPIGQSVLIVRPSPDRNHKLWLDGRSGDGPGLGWDDKGAFAFIVTD